MSIQIVSLDMPLYYDFRVFFFFSSFSFPPFVLYTMAFFLFPPSMCGSGVQSPFFHFSCLFLNLPFLAVRLHVHCSGITSTLMRPEG